MKFQTLLLALLLTLFVAFTSCKEEKKTETAPSQTEVQSEVQSESTADDLTAEVQYQCPMDCEHGKTYDAEGKCPVCKMDLKPVSKETSMATCKMRAGGECTCKKENCACENCPKHSKS
jgi:hypothetical protein